MAEQDVSQTSTALAEHRPPAPPAVPGVMSDDEIQRTYRVATALAASGIFKDVRSAEQAFGKLIVGRALGLNEAQSLSLYAFDGKVEIPATMLASFVRTREGLDYSVTEHTAETCSILFWENGDERGTSTFTKEDAERASLTGKDNWKKYPKAMLFARALSQGVRWYVPEVLGGLPVYTEGEIERVPNLAEGQGTGDEPGWGTVPIAAVHEIEKIIRKAEKLGHAGLASRTAAQMLLNGQSDDVVRKWITDAAAELDGLQAKMQVERGETPAEDIVEGQGAATEEPEPDDPPETSVVREYLTREDADPVLEPDGSTSWREQNAHLEPAVQLELAEARLAGALNEAEEREARAEVERLRGES